MRRIAMIVLVTVMVLGVLPAAADTAPDERDGLATAGTLHNLEHPLGVQQQAMRAEAMEAQLAGKADGATYRAGNGRFVELELEDTDQVFVMLGEFGDEVDSAYGGDPGPAHNTIERPDRRVDNTTIWRRDFNRSYFENMYFDRMVDWYYDQSSGRYTIEGEVQDWVQVPYNSARYGNNDCGSIVCATVWDFLADTATAWYDEQIAAGSTPEEIAAYLARYDEWDRYDSDGDGNFDEPDGYIDHFQIVHAGVGEETGGGAQGEDAIWSHRWYTYFSGIGTVGPDGFAPLGGFEIGDTNMFVGDYTIQPENGGLGVFAHEYAHDLGLPDQYDTAGGENSSAFWTVMSSGSYLGKGRRDIGDNPGDFNAWEKFQLGWLNYDVAFAGETSTHTLGPAEFNSNDAQALFVVLPDRERTVELADPPEGDYAYYSGSGDDLDNTMTTTSEIAVPAGGGDITMQMWYDIEVDWDYGYVRASADGGATWENLAGSITTNDDPNGQNFGNGITGASGGWVDAVFDASAYAGQNILLQLRYWTDGAVSNPGFLVDNIAVGDFASNAEPGDEAQWAIDGFSQTTGTETTLSFNAYVAEFRQYRLNDFYLKTGPYNFSFVDRPDFVEHFPYQDGLLISYWDNFWTDNNTSQHPGEGLILPIDAHPDPLIAPDGSPWRARVQAYDSTFTKSPTDEITLSYKAGDVQYGPTTYGGYPGVSVFDDSNSYWSPETPFASVITPDTGTQIRIDRNIGIKMQVTVTTG